MLSLQEVSELIAGNNGSLAARIESAIIEEAAAIGTEASSDVTEGRRDWAQRALSSPAFVRIEISRGWVGFKSPHVDDPSEILDATDEELREYVSSSVEALHPQGQ